MLETSGAGVWHRTAQVPEIVRVGADHAGPAFGMVLGLAALPDGGVAVLDAEGAPGPIIELFDSAGHLRKTLGRDGAGPGEFRIPRSNGVLSALVDGTILLLDRANARIDRWKPDGTVLPAIPLPPGGAVLGFPPYLLPGPDNSIYLHVRVRRTKPPAELQVYDYGFVRLLEDGTVMDTLFPPPLAFGPNLGDAFGPTDLWNPLPDGRILQVRTDRLGFTIASPQGKVMASWHPVSSVQVSGEERREWDALQAWFDKRDHSAARPHQGIAVTKAVAWNCALDGFGRVWFQRHVPAILGPPVEFPGTSSDRPPPMRSAEPPVFAAFTLAGTYLGEVSLMTNGLHPEAPLAPYAVAFGREAVWGLMLNRDDIPVLVKWRIPS